MPHHEPLEFPPPSYVDVARTLALSVEKLSEHAAVEHGCKCGIIPVVMDNVSQFRAGNLMPNDVLIHFCDEDRERLGQGVGAFPQCPLCSLRHARSLLLGWKPTHYATQEELRRFLRES